MPVLSLYTSGDAYVHARKALIRLAEGATDTEVDALLRRSVCSEVAFRQWCGDAGIGKEVWQ